MHTKRIIPCLDVNNGRVVKGVNFVNLQDAGDPVEIAAAYDKAGADEVVFLDITASSDARGTVIDMVRKVAEKVFIPFTVGGGIRTVDDFKAILREGADKISVNSAAINDPELMKRLVDENITLEICITSNYHTKEVNAIEDHPFRFHVISAFFEFSAFRRRLPAAYFRTVSAEEGKHDHHDAQTHRGGNLFGAGEIIG